MKDDLEAMKKSTAPATFGQLVRMTDGVASGLAQLMKAHAERLEELEHEVAHLRRLVEQDR